MTITSDYYLISLYDEDDNLLIENQIVNENKFTFKNLDNSKRYYYKVQAVRNNIRSTASISPLIDLSSVPTPIADDATEITETSFKINWHMESSYGDYTNENEGFLVEVYNQDDELIYSTNDNNYDPETQTFSITIESGVTFYNGFFVVLEEGEAYYYKIKSAYYVESSDSYLYSEYSNTINVTMEGGDIIIDYTNKGMVYSSNESGQWQNYSIDPFNPSNKVILTENPSIEDHYITYSEIIKSYIFSRRISGKLEIHKINIITGTKTALTSSSSYDCKFPSISNNGQMISFYRNGQVVIIDANSGTELYAWSPSYHSLEETSIPFNADDTKVLVSEIGITTDIIAEYNLNGSSPSIKRNELGCSMAKYFPDYSRILFMYRPTNNIKSINLSGGDLVTYLSDSDSKYFPSLSPDMNYLMYLSPSNNSNIKYFKINQSALSTTENLTTGSYQYEFNNGWTVSNTKDIVVNSNTKIYYKYLGNTVDYSLNGNRGVINGVAPYSSRLIENDNFCLDLTSSDGSLEIPLSSSFNSNTITIDSVHNFSEFRSGLNLIHSRFEGNNSQWLFYYVNNSTPHLLIYLYPQGYSGTSHISFYSPITLKINEDYLFTISLDKNNNIIKLFVNKEELTWNYNDGSITSLSSFNMNLACTAPIRIHARYNSGIDLSEKAKSKIARFAYHTEYRGKSIHDQSFENLCSDLTFSNNHNWDLLFNRSSMTGSGLSITDSANGLTADFYKNTGHNGSSDYPTWISSFMFGNGIKFDKPASALRIADNSVIDISNKTTWLFIIKFTAVSGTQYLLNKVSNTDSSNNAYQIYMDSASANARVFASDTTYGTATSTQIIDSADLNIIRGLAIQFDLTSHTAKFIKDQNTVGSTYANSWNTISTTNNSAMDLFIGSFLWENGSAYLAGNELKAEIYGIAMIKDALTEVQIKAEFAQMGLI